METKDSIIHYSGYRETIEALDELFPNFQCVSLFTFVIKAVNSIDRTTFMISSKQEEVLWEFDFIRQHQAYDL